MRCASAPAPSGQMTEFLRGPAVENIIDPAPEFSWMVHSDKKNTLQVAYQILVAGAPDQLEAGKADLWDSGKGGVG